MINNVTLVGRLTKDPDLRYTPKGDAVATFTLAINRTFTNQQGDREADFINCVVWRRQAENAANYLKKGHLTGVTGRIQTRNYDNGEGKRIYVTEVMAESVQYLEPKGSGNGGQQQSRQQGNSYNGSGGQSGGSYTKIDDDPFNNNGQTIDISDDDLPF